MLKNMLLQRIITSRMSRESNCTLKIELTNCIFNIPNIIEFVLNTTGATSPTGYPLVTPLCKSLSFGGCSYDGGAVTRF